MGGKGARVASRLAGIVAASLVVICAGSLQVKAQCAVDEYLSGGTCTGCAHTSATCSENGFALVACGVGETTDVSTCTDCASMGMFVSGDGMSCVASSCPAGEAVVAGGPGETTCAECLADTFATNGVCQECGYTSDICRFDGLILGACGIGESSDVSTCMSCTNLGMHVSADGMSCVPSNCPEGEVIDAGPPGSTDCARCPSDFFANVVCNACAYRDGSCTEPGFALTQCPPGSSTDVSACSNCTSMGQFVNAGGMGCSGMCSPGETVVAGAPGEQNCATCGEGTFSGGGLCEPCMHTAESCSGDGIVFLGGCGAGEVSDVSSCVNCTDMNMFVSEDGLSCVASTCPPDETVVPGPPGDMTCSGCPADMYQNGSGCVACAVSAGDCGNGSAAVAMCGVGETADVSTCMNCTELGMFVSADGLSCGGTCSGGLAVVAGAPGDETCEVCDMDFFANSGVCDPCAITPDNCNEDGFALTRCEGLLLSDISFCSNCTALGQFVNAAGTLCSGTCADGETVIPGAPGEQNCAMCGEGTFSSGGLCVECAATPESCSGGGVFFVAGCGVGEVSDVSVCTNCTAMGMFLGNDGMSCVPSNCAAGHGVVAGSSGGVCEPCGADMFSDTGVCELCAHTTESCSGAGFAFDRCMSAESDVSTCFDCTSAGQFVNAEGTGCSGMCSPGETVVAGAPGEENCAACGEGMFSGGGLCEACVYTAESCSGDGLALSGCDSAASDVSSCANCTDMEMFVSGDGSSCIPSTCPPDETVVAGPPGDMTCSGCPADMYQNGSGCVACAVSAGDCGNGSAAVAMCGVGETADVSTCMNCTELGMFVSADGLSCGGTCSGGLAVVAGAPGDETCEVCDMDFFANSGVCDPCAITPDNCNEDGFALTRCEGLLLSDISFCSNCTALGQFVNAAGTLCSGTCADGETVIPGAPGEQNCAMCGEGTFSSGGLCVECAATPESCSGGGVFFVAGCGVGEVSDVSVCTNCTAMGMFLGNDGMSCTGNCSAGEVPVAGPPGSSECMACPVDTYQNVGDCVTCASTRATCGGSNLAVSRCDVGSSSDVSTCMNCTLIDMVSSASGEECVEATRLLSDSGEEDDEGVSAGGIAGIAIGVGVAVGGALYLLKKKHSKKAGTRVRKVSGGGGDEELVNARG